MFLKKTLVWSCLKYKNKNKVFFSNIEFEQIDFKQTRSMYIGDRMFEYDYAIWTG